MPTTSNSNHSQHQIPFVCRTETTRLKNDPLNSNTTKNPVRTSAYSSWLQCKPLQVVLRQEEEENAVSRRHYTLLDLILIGLASTLGSGIFCLAGFVAHHYAGPATFGSFFISGLAAACSGVCYAELAARIPASGSAYSYAYVYLGELAAVIGAACLVLEFGISGAAVARNWGDKVTRYLQENKDNEPSHDDSYSPMAFAVSLVCMLLLLLGVRESKHVSNVFTLIKVALIGFMLVGGCLLVNFENLQPLSPFGTAGVLRGATFSFFGYLGYDEACCFASEAIHPQRDIPRAVLYTLAISTFIFMAAAVVLVGMQPYDLISDSSGFPVAFEYQGWIWASRVSAIGEIVTLPVVVLICLMAQPRLQLAMAQDGLLPQLFARRDRHGNLWWGALISGIIMTLLATFVPFRYLDDLISGGVLAAFSITNTCLILMRQESPKNEPKLLERSLLWFHVLSFGTGLLVRHVWNYYFGKIVSVAFVLAIVWLGLQMGVRCCHREVAASTTIVLLLSMSERTNEQHGNEKFFQTPFVPLLPCLGIFVNWYLVAQLEFQGLLLLLLYVGIVLGLYFGFAPCRTSPPNWRVTAAQDPERVSLRTISLPRVLSSEYDTASPKVDHLAS